MVAEEEDDRETLVEDRGELASQKPQDELDWLNRRLSELERKIIGLREHHTSSFQGDFSVNVEKNLKSRLETVEETHSTFIGEHEKKFLLKYARMKPFLGSHHELPSLSPMTEDPAVKEMLVLSFYNKSAVIGKELEELQSLEKHVNPPYLSQLSEWKERLLRLQTTQARIDVETKLLHEKTEKLVDKYVEMSNIVSMKFLAASEMLPQ
eukprot:g2445.t1